MINDVMNETAFPCTACGACCRRVGHIVQSAIKKADKVDCDPYLRAFLSFPFPLRDDGSCSNLNEHNRCDVYDHRPDICNISKVWDLFYSQSGRFRDRESFYMRNAEGCNKLMEVDGVPQQYNIDLTKWQITKDV